MAKETHKLTDRLTFSIKKIIMELTQLYYGGQETCLVIEENARGRGEGIYRTLKIVCDSNVIFEGHTLEVIFKQLREKIKKDFIPKTGKNLKNE